jgi:hypothetical protein
MPFWSRAMRHSAGSRSSTMRHTAGTRSSALRHTAGTRSSAMRHTAGSWSSAMRHTVAQDINTNSIQKKSLAVCQHSAGPHIFVYCISQRIRNKIRKYFRAWIMCLDGIVSGKKNQRIENRVIGKEAETVAWVALPVLHKEIGSNPSNILLVRSLWSVTKMRAKCTPTVILHWSNFYSVENFEVFYFLYIGDQ